MERVDRLLGRVPKRLPPVVTHAQTAWTIERSEVTLPQVLSLHGFNGITIVAVAQDIAIRRREVNGAVPRIDGQRPAQNPVRRPAAGLSRFGYWTEVPQALGLHVIAQEVTIGPRKPVKASTLCVHA